MTKADAVWLWDRLVDDTPTAVHSLLISHNVYANVNPEWTPDIAAFLREWADALDPEGKP